MWEAHRRFGSLPWAELIQPAVNLAEGIVIHDRLGPVASTIRERTTGVPRYCGGVPRERPAHREPAIAWPNATLQKRLARIQRARERRLLSRTHGRTRLRLRCDAAVASSREKISGNMTPSGAIRFMFQYRRHTIISMPPPSSGGATIAEILNILEGFDLRSLGYLSRDHVHLWTEAVKARVRRSQCVSRGSRFRFPADCPDDLGRVRGAAARRHPRRPCDARRAMCDPAWERFSRRIATAARRESEHTTHYSVVDREG